MSKISQEQIEASKKLATEKYQAKKNIEQDYRNELKKGMKYFHENNLPLYEFLLDKYNVQLTWEKHNGTLVYAFCFQNEKDFSNSSTKLAKSILGLRLMNNGPYVFDYDSIDFLVEMLSEEEIALAGRALLTCKAILSSELPDCIRREFKKFANDCPYVYGNCIKVSSRE